MLFRESDGQRRAVWLSTFGGELPVDLLSSDSNGRDIKVAGVENNLAFVGKFLQGQGDTAVEALLLEVDLIVCSGVLCLPGVVVGQSVGITRLVNASSCTFDGSVRDRTDDHLRW